MRSLYYDRDGLAITQKQWGELFHDINYKRVARTKIMDSSNPDIAWDVSTVWLGLDHSFGDGDIPLIFETMVFAQDSLLDQECERYSTLAEAQQGHTAMVVSVASELKDPIVMDAEENK